MAFHDDAIFPATIAANSTFGWGFNTSIVESTGGQEQRVARREVVQHVGDVSTGINGPEQLFALKKFHMARRGSLYGWRFRDPLDHASHFLDHTIPGVAPTPTDQILGTGTGSRKTFQLRKTYDDATMNYVRRITKPIEGTVRVAINGTEQNVGWMVNKATGVVTFTAAPAIGAVVTAGFEFHTPCRFEVDADRAMEIAFREYKYGDIPRIGIIELLDEGFADEDAWFGGAFTLELLGDFSLEPVNGRYAGFIPLVGNLSVNLPDLNTVPAGGPIFYIHSPNSGSPTFTIRDSQGAAIQTVAQTEIYQMVVGVTASNTKFWLAIAS